MNLHLAHHLSQHPGCLRQSNVRIASLAGLWMKGRFAQPIIDEGQTSMRATKFREADCLRSQVEGDQTRWSGHGVKGLSRNCKMPSMKRRTSITTLLTYRRARLLAGSGYPNGCVLSQSSL